MRGGTRAMIAHHFTVDLEEFFQVAALESRVPRSEWGHFESRLAAPVAQLLDLLASHHAQATFFKSLATWQCPGVLSLPAFAPM